MDSSLDLFLSPLCEHTTNRILSNFTNPTSLNLLPTSSIPNPNIFFLLPSQPNFTSLFLDFAALFLVSAFLTDFLCSLFLSLAKSTTEALACSVCNSSRKYRTSIRLSLNLHYLFPAFFVFFFPHFVAI